MEGELEGEGLDMVDDETDEEEEEEEREWDEEDVDEWGDREFVSDLSGEESDDGLNDLDIVVSFGFHLNSSCKLTDSRIVAPNRLNQTQTQSKKTLTRKVLNQRKPHSENGRHLHNHPNLHLANDQRRRQRVRLSASHPYLLLRILTGFWFISSGGPRVEVEYEHEMESVPLAKSALANW